MRVCSIAAACAADGRAAGDVVDRAYRDAQRFVAAAAEDPAFVAHARRQAETVVAAFFKATGWTVTVRWAD